MMSSHVKLGLASFALESAAVALVFLNGSDEAVLYQYFVLHALASGLMTPVACALLPRHYRQPLPAVAGLLFALCFFIPVLGLLGFSSAAILSRWLPYFRARGDFAAVSVPVYEPARKPRAPLNRAGHVREQLMNQGASLAMRMRALLAIQHMSPRHSSSVLREALSDNADDLRLLAYGMLESREKELTQRIQHAQQRYQRYSEQHHAEEHYNATRELAELYWELVYQNLVQGDMRDFALQQVMRYANEALRFQVRDAGLWVISGRMRMLQGDFSGAGAAFSAAIALGFPAARAEPYLAELAYLRRDFASVRQLMRRINSAGRTPQLHPIAVFWE